MKTRQYQIWEYLMAHGNSTCAKIAAKKGWSLKSVQNAMSILLRQGNAIKTRGSIPAYEPIINNPPKEYGSPSNLGVDKNPKYVERPELNYAATMPIIQL